MDRAIGREVGPGGAHGSSPSNGSSGRQPGTRGRGAAAGRKSDEGGFGRSRNRALDGLRGLAVAAVLAYHGGVSWASGGFLGFDAFFLLSGYLITTLLLTEWARTSGIALGAFWARRARRLLPALMVMIL